eukprot:COSAG01_NODE_43325_length_430_cov_4067.803625_1_plen_73_part_10
MVVGRTANSLLSAAALFSVISAWYSAGASSRVQHGLEEAAARELQLTRALHDSEARLASAMIDVQKMQKQLLR